MNGKLHQQDQAGDYYTTDEQKQETCPNWREMLKCEHKSLLICGKKFEKEMNIASIFETLRNFDCIIH